MVLYKNRLYNNYTNTYPVFIHGNGPAKLFLNHIENYIETNLNHNYAIVPKSAMAMATATASVQPDPEVFFALYCNSADLLQFDDFFQYIKQINYKNKLVYVYDAATDLDVKRIVEENGFNYKSDIKSYVYDDFIYAGSKYYFLLEQRCMITNRDIIYELLPNFDYTHRILCPMLTSNEKRLVSNYWGAIESSGFYKRSVNYEDLIDCNYRGSWNVPYVSGAILFDADIIKNWNLSKVNKFTAENQDMALCYNLRSNTLFMYMINMTTYGHIV